MQNLSNESIVWPLLQRRSNMAPPVWPGQTLLLHDSGCSEEVTGAQNSGQLFALIVHWGSALLTAADSLLINGKRCIYILVSGTTQLLRWQGARCWLRLVTSPTGFPYGLIVTNPIEKRLIDLLTDCLVDCEGCRGVKGEAGPQGKRQKAQSFYNGFLQRFGEKNKQKKKTSEVGRIWKQLTKVSSNISTSVMWAKGFAYSSLCVSMSEFVCLYLCVTIWMSTRAGVNLSAVQKLERLEIIIFFKDVKTNLRMKASVYVLQLSQREENWPQPCMSICYTHECLHYSSYD